MSYSAVVFDLDGTLVDSFSDIHFSVNELLRAHKGRALSAAEVRQAIGRGVRHLLRSCMEISHVPEYDMDSLLREYEELYDRNCLNESVLYEGVAAGLSLLAPLPLAVLSNKPEAACRKILYALRVASFFEIIAGGDSYPELKPSPLPLQRIAAGLDIPIDQILMVGDSIWDIKCAHTAGCDACAVAWGFQDAKLLRSLDPKYCVSTFSEIVTLVH